MFKLVLALLFIVSTSSALAQVSIGINKPGFYGRIDIGGYPQPQLVYPEPVVIYPDYPPARYGQPIYLVVPPGHAQNWRQHCHRYSACNQRVYLVQEQWYRDQWQRQRDQSRSSVMAERSRVTGAMTT
jgi:hypothetical protein